MSEEQEVEVAIPRELYELLNNTIIGKSFPTVDEYIIYVLRVVAGKVAPETTKEDTRKVEDRLKRLGYL